MKLSATQIIRSLKSDARFQKDNSEIRNQKSAFSAARAGFTLIELLVVIGILGILAAALVATIDPFEQLNKATDARTENTLVEFQNGLLRYYTIRSEMPWNDTPTPCNGGNDPTGLPLMNTAGTASNCVTALIDQGEIKASFSSSRDLQNIFLTETGINSPVVCYMPISKAKQRDANTKFNDEGEEESGVTCKSENATTGVDCHWCSL